jgi:hypothetical protein
MLKADAQRAQEVLELLDAARDKAYEAKNLLELATLLASNDSYRDVATFDAQDIKDVIAVFKIAITKPLNQLGSRWLDIVHGRKETINANLK